RQRRPGLTADHPRDGGAEAPPGRSRALHGGRLRPQHGHDRDRLVSEAGAGMLPAALPPAGLPGLDPAFSQLVTVPSGRGAQHTWHLLDNGPELERLGHTPVGTILCVHGNPTWSYLWRSLVAAATDAAASGAPAWRV